MAWGSSPAGRDYPSAPWADARGKVSADRQRSLPPDRATPNSEAPHADHSGSHRAGGRLRRRDRLIADEVPALDESKQPLGICEALFGVTGSGAVREDPVSLPGDAGRLWGRRGYQPAGATVVSASAGVPLVLSNAAGAGQAALLNFPLKDCYLDALVQAGPAVNLILDTLRQATVGRPGNVTCDNPNIEVSLRLTPQGTGLLLVINHESRDDTAQVTLPHLPPAAVVRDLITGARLPVGPGNSLELRCPWGETRALGLFPSDPSGLALEALEPAYSPGDPVGYALVVGGPRVRGNYLLDVSAIGPDGHLYQSFSALTATLDATCERSFRLPLNAQPGTWTVQATSLWDGSRVEGHFAVQ